MALLEFLTYNLKVYAAHYTKFQSLRAHFKCTTLAHMLRFFLRINFKNQLSHALPLAFMECTYTLCVHVAK